MTLMDMHAPDARNGGQDQKRTESRVLATMTRLPINEKPVFFYFDVYNNKTIVR